MAEDFQSLISRALGALLPKADAQVMVVTVPGGADQITLRELLRLSLADALPLLNTEEREGLLDLTRRPSRVGDAHLSISHLSDQGAWLLANLPCGIDLERTDRVRHDVLARVCHADELDAVPEPATLWTAKEAAFKACVNGGGTTQVLSQIEIHGWAPVSMDGLEGWRFFWRSRISQEAGCGASSHWNGTSFSFAMLSSQLWS